MNHRRISLNILRLGIRGLPGLLLIFSLLIAAYAPASAITIVDYSLVGPGGPGGQIVISLSGYPSYVGTTGGLYYGLMQSFIPVPGVLDEILIQFGANNGTPTGTISWDVLQNYNGVMSTTEASGTFTPVENAENTINVSSGPFLYNASYWLRLIPTDDQTEGNYWNVLVNWENPYASGAFGVYFYKTPSYYIYPAADAAISIVTVEGAAPEEFVNDQLAQAFTVGNDLTISGVKLYLKKVGAPADDLTYTIETEAGNAPSTIVVATATVNESTLGTSYGYIEFTFASNLTLAQGARYQQRLVTDRTSTADYVVWGAVQVTPFSTEYFAVHNLAAAAWVPQSAQAIYEFTVVSGSLPATQEPTANEYIDLPVGGTGTFAYTMSGGEMLIGILLVILIGLIFFAMLLWRLRGA